MSREELEKLYGRLSDNLMIADVIHDNYISISFKDGIKIANMIMEKINELDNAIDIQKGEIK